MMIHEITREAGKYRPRKRVGRGRASGLGKTSGRGHKGAGSRAGSSYRAYFEGGQMPFSRRIPKRGFSNAAFSRLFSIVNVKTLEARFADGAEVDAAALAETGAIRDATLPLKVLGEGELTKRLTVTAAKFSAGARTKIEAAGGSVREVAAVTWTRAPKERGAGAAKDAGKGQGKSKGKGKTKG